MNNKLQPQKSGFRRACRNAAGLMGAALLILPLLTSCGQGAQKSGPQENTPPASAGTQNTPSIPDLPMAADWPSDLAPAQLPEYTAGTVTAAVDGEGVLTIKVADTGRSDLEDYLEKLQGAGWIVTSNSYETKTVLGLYTVTFALQAGDTMLQIDVYTAEAGAWPADKIPPDILEPSSGTLVGEVEVQETMENAWYFTAWMKPGHRNT